MSKSLRELLDRAEHGKAGKRGFLKSIPRGLRGYNPYYDDNDFCDYEGNYRDKTEITEQGFIYRLWDYILMEKKQNVMSLYSWDSVTTCERLDTVRRYYRLPLRFTFRGGELRCNEWRFRKIVIDTLARTVKIYIDNEKEDIETFRY